MLVRMLQLEDAFVGSSSVVEPVPRALISAASIVAEMNPDQQRAVGNESAYPSDGPSTAQVGRAAWPYMMGLESKMSVIGSTCNFKLAMIGIEQARPIIHSDDQFRLQHTLVSKALESPNCAPWSFEQCGDRRCQLTLGLCL